MPNMLIWKSQKWFITTPDRFDTSKREILVRKIDLLYTEFQIERRKDLPSQILKPLSAEFLSERCGQVFI